MAILGFASPAYAQTSTISGTLTLPASLGNAVGNYHFSVVARVANGTGSQVSATGNPIITDGTNSAPFTIIVPDDPDPDSPDEQWRIDYICNLNPSTNDCDGIAPLGSYDGADSAAVNTDALLLDLATDHLNLAFPVIEADIITGTISLPGALTAPSGGSNFTLRVLDSGGTFPLTDIVTIPEGQSSINYQLNIATNGSATRRVIYDCNFGCDGLFDQGFYVSNTEMSTDLNDATPIAGGTPQTNINLVVIPTNSISGILSLPPPFVSPVGAMEFRMTAQPVGSITGASVQTITIGAGATQRQFNLDVVGNAGGVWRVIYDCLTNCDGLVEFGFYNTTLTTIVFSEGTELAAAQDHANIDIEVLDIKSISGQVSLPAGTANGDIGLSVTARTSNLSVIESDNITIPDGSSSVGYQIDVPKQFRDLTISVTCSSNCADLIETVFYNSSGTVADSANAEGIAGTTSHTNIDMTLLSPSALIGTIGLPGSDNAGTNIDLQVIATLDDESLSASVPVTISQGTNNANFEVAVSPQAGRHWLLSYQCMSGCAGFVNTAFFADAGTTPDQASARQFNGDRVENLNFDLFAGNAIAGTISLPNALLAPTGGTGVSITAVDTNGGQPTQTLTTTIGQSSNSVSYQVDVPADPFASWRIGYQCSSGCDDVLEFGFFSDSGTTGDSGAATLLSGNNFPHTGKNIVMRAKRQIGGTLTLANGALAPAGGMTFIVRATDVADAANSFSSTETIDAGSGATSYLVETESEAGSLWRISYTCIENCTGFSAGFFNGTGTVPIPENATALAGGVNHSGIDMNVLESNTIAGTLSLPGSQTAGAGGFTVTVSAIDSVNSGNANTSVTILEGESSAAYTLEVRPDTNAQWRVRYSCFNLPVCEGFLDFAFHSSAGTVLSFTEATVLNGAQDHVAIDLEIIGATSFSGTLSLPGDMVAPAGGIELRTTAEDSDNSFFADLPTLVVPEGGDSIDYLIDVPIDPDVTWNLGYTCTAQCDGLLENGFYASSGTVASRAIATDLVGDTSQTGLDMELLTSAMLSGNLSLPGADIATTDIELSVIARDINTNFQNTSNIVIASGSDNEDFVIDIPAILDSSYSLRYSCISGCDNLVTSGFFKAESPTVLTEEEATEIVLNPVEDISGLDFSLIGENAVTGVVVLPDSQLAEGDITLTVTLSDNNSSAAFTQDVTISDGEGDADFGFVIPGASSGQWLLRYDCNSNCLEWVESGFFNESGSVQNAVDATLLAGGENHSDLQFGIIPKRVISGLLQLPGGAESSDIEFRIELTVPDGSLSTSVPVTIIAGTTSVEFNFLQTPDASKTWRLGYQCLSNCDGRASGFFASGGTTPVPASATTLNGTSSFIDRNMTVLPSLMVEGEISLPDGNTAGVGGIEFFVIALDIVNEDLRAVSEAFTMGSGLSSVPYRINLPNVANARWAIRYFCATNCPDQFFQQGFFAGPGMMRAFPEGAERLTVTENVSGIDMTVLEKFFISGTIQLLAGRVAPAGGMEFLVGAFDINGGSGSATAETNVNLNADANEINYRFEIPGDVQSEWRVSYGCQVGCADSLLTGFYATEGTTPDANNATLLGGGRSHTGIDLLVLDDDATFNNDDDGDGVLNDADNCRFVPNADQADSNNNGIGDVCDVDDEICFPVATSSNNVALICL
ncbi:MAG: thrombospondin type 3 repeat-containing protein [Granulosicoccus sp.]|nr:thrombospondin type 3 repeat-containing protein [Granulosicoccus sp.]